MSQYTIDSNHMYTQPGVSGLYFGNSERIIFIELGSYDVIDYSNKIIYTYSVSIDNMLDVSNPPVRHIK